MKTLALLLTTFVPLFSFDLHARGGGGFHGGGEFRGGDEHFGGDADGAEFRDDGGEWEGGGVNVGREGGDDYRVDDGTGDANVDIRPEGGGMDNVNVRTGDGRDYDASVAGPDGYRSGYIWRDGGYVAVNCEPWAAYAVPFGAWAGWSIVTQPDYIQYPVYATYPIETAVQVALMNLGLYSGPVDGETASCSAAIEQFQEQNNLPVTGTITPALLGALGIQATGE